MSIRMREGWLACVRLGEQAQHCPTLVGYKTGLCLGDHSFGAG